MRLAELVDAAAAAAATSSRRGKVAALAALLGRAGPDDVALAASYLAGEPRQGRIGVGWGALAGVEAVPADPSDAEPVPADASAAEPAAAAAVADDGAVATPEGPPAGRPLTLLEVDEALDALAALSGPGSRSARTDALARLRARSSAAEWAFLRGLLLGELRQGALEGLLVQAVASAWGVGEGLVRRAVMFSGDVGRVARAAAAGGEAALRDFRLELFRPVQPMLASTAADLAEAFAGGGPAALEPKLDGARVQVHARGGLVRVYTRALRDVTDEYPGVAEAARAVAADAFVLDGEALALRPDGRPEAFQDSMRRGAALRPFFFDVLHVDGRDLVDEPWRLRREALERLVPPSGRMDALVTSDPAAAEGVLRRALAAGHEGVMVKDPDATYEAGRRGAAWRKVKPVHTLDLVVLAVEWGSGRRRGLLSNLHLGARGQDGGFVMLGKTFKGLTDELLAWQTRELLAREVRREGAVVVVRPELVVEVAFDGVQTSPRYPGGVALRFARVRRYRDDKGPDEADTIEMVRSLRRD